MRVRRPTTLLTITILSLALTYCRQPLVNFFALSTGEESCCEELGDCTMGEQGWATDRTAGADGCLDDQSRCLCESRPVKRIPALAAQPRPTCPNASATATLLSAPGLSAARGCVMIPSPVSHACRDAYLRHHSFRI